MKFLTSLCVFLVLFVALEAAVCPFNAVGGECTENWSASTSATRKRCQFGLDCKENPADAGKFLCYAKYSVAVGGKCLAGWSKYCVKGSSCVDKKCVADIALGGACNDTMNVCTPSLTNTVICKDAKCALKYPVLGEKCPDVALPCVGAGVKCDGTDCVKQPVLAGTCDNDDVWKQCYGATLYCDNTANNVAKTDKCVALPTKVDDGCSDTIKCPSKTMYCEKNTTPGKCKLLPVLAGTCDQIMGCANQGGMIQALATAPWLCSQYTSLCVGAALGEMCNSTLPCVSPNRCYTVNGISKCMAPCTAAAVNCSDYASTDFCCEMASTVGMQLVCNNNKCAAAASVTTGVADNDAACMLGYKYDAVDKDCTVMTAVACTKDTDCQSGLITGAQSSGGHCSCDTDKCTGVVGPTCNLEYQKVYYYDAQKVITGVTNPAAAVVAKDFSCCLSKTANGKNVNWLAAVEVANPCTLTGAGSSVTAAMRLAVAAAVATFLLAFLLF